MEFLCQHRERLDEANVDRERLHLVHPPSLRGAHFGHGVIRLSREGTVAQRSHPSTHMPNMFANGGNGGGLASDLDLGDGLPSEEIQQKFAGRSDEPSRRLASPGSHSLVCPSPRELESHAA